ncbi:PIG-L family deacetylase [Candidatus Pelagibacter bacterium]|nr:PIG-L family deacetylase [Candidatus Pelagibacter bacterium]
MKKKILIVVAHTDDETFGLGGTIAKHSKNKDKIFAMSFTDGVSSRNKDRLIKKKRQIASQKAANILGFKWIKNLEMPDNQLDTVSLLSIVKEIEKVKRSINPDLVYTHFSSDLNIDHQIISRATLTAFRPETKDKSFEFRFFEVPSSTDFGFYKLKKSFKPNLYNCINNFWKKKEKAIKCYKDEIKKKPHSRSLYGIKNLASYRGSTVGKKYAEAFEIVRKTIV